MARYLPRTPATMVAPIIPMHTHSLRHSRSSKAAVVLLMCAGALLLISQHLATKTFLARLIASQHPFSASHDEVDASEYRQKLSIIRPLDTVSHSRTLGVADRIYVVNLPARSDRREAMSDLERAMDLEFTWHNATDFHSKDVQNILERVRWWRNENRVDNSLPKADPSPFKFRWADDIHVSGPDLGLSGSDLWADSDTKASSPPLPPPPSPDTRPPTLDTYGEEGNHFGSQHLLPAQISCWHSHYQVLRKIAEGDDGVAIVFEDDIDVEWDLERRLRNMWGALPVDWDMVMLGHCHGQEWTHPALKGAPTLHPARHTLCTHAYAVNQRSAQHIVRRLRSESFAYSRNIDHAIQHLSSHHEIKVFSIYPPVVVQTYDTESDIIPGRSRERVQWLEDSTRERIALAEKQDQERKLNPDSR